MNDFKKHTQADVDSYWDPLPDNRRVPWEAMVSRNVVAALEAQCKDSGVSIWRESVGPILIQWTGFIRPSGRDVYAASVTLSRAVDKFIDDNISSAGNSENAELDALASELEKLAKRVRKKMK